ncbi:MAG: phospholipase D-like domain-containing protein [Gammaproteobacteria bacterium]|nr:phospholipase D-like domain-containing protein [Gammaproteobacteria bacterium]
MKDLPVGLYDLLHTKQLHNRIEKAGLLDRAVWAKFEPDELKTHLAIPLAREIALFISESISGKSSSQFEKALNDAFDSPELLLSILESIKPVSSELLQQIKPEPPLVASTDRPDTPLSASSLLTGSSRSPALRTQIIKELATCDKADWLVSFIKFAGIVPLLPALREFTQTPSEDGSPRLRIATTSYMGATDLKAISELLGLPNTEIRVSYDTKRTRLHAKAYLFHRNTGFGSAYIGSANVSKAALDEGLEWTAKISQYETDHLWQHENKRGR